MTPPNYEITGQTYANERQADGSYVPVVQITFTTKTTPPVTGTVSVPQALLKDKVAYFEAVKAAVDNAAEAHSSVASLGQ